MPGTIRNAGGVPFLILKGIFVVRQGHRPDGDTIHFAATSRFSPGPVRQEVPVSTTGAKSIAVRYQSIDAPEKAQPLGAAARDVALKHLGISPSAVGLGEDDFVANGPTVKVHGWLATHGMDINRRQLGYVFRSSPGFAHGAIVSADRLLPAIKQSTNYHLLVNGWVFPAFYSNTDERHAAVFQQAAERLQNARTKKGVWQADTTRGGFIPIKTALGSAGALVYPKFFRRVAKWKKAKPDSDAFITWLKGTDDGKKLVEGARPNPIHVWELFERAGKTKVCVPYDVTRLWFKE
jgi:endonuclease YncB( thermonuclease family)